MKFLPLIWSTLAHKKLRTIFTFCAIAFALLLFGILGAVKNAFSGDSATSGADRLRMIHKVSVVQALPVHYYDKIVATRGVAAATYVLWFGGVYQDPRNFFAQLAVSPTYLDVYREHEVTESARERWRTTRTGALVGKALADRFEWRVGDRIPLRSTIYQQADGSDAWEFTVEGIFTGGDETHMLFHHEYLEESAPSARGEVRWFVMTTAPGSQPAIVAQRLDAQFGNSRAPTKTSTERAFLQSFANQIGDTTTIITSIVAATFFVILLVVGNAIAQSIRERLGELAVLKAIGFSDTAVMGFVFAESALLCFSAGGLGLFVARLVLTQGVPTQGMTGDFALKAIDIAQGIAWISLLIIAGAIGPAITAYRTSAAVGLRRL